MTETEKLHDMIDSVVNDNSEKAQADFHDYVSKKVKEIIQPDHLSDPNLNNNDE